MHPRHAALPARHGERGSAAVEFAIVLPVLITLVMGIIDFGSLFSTWSTLRQGVWAGARAGSVANWSSAPICTLTFTGGGAPPSTDLQSLMCLAKAQIGLNQPSTRVDVLIDDYTLSTTGASWAVGAALTICAETPARSASGVFGSLFSGRYLRSKTTIRIEQPAANAETQGYETDPSGGGWSWCTPQSPAP